MIIKCPECGKEISEFSEKCIGCGYPLAKMKKEQEKQKAKEKYLSEHKEIEKYNTKKDTLKRANGKGGVRFLGNNRRKPYAAVITVKNEGTKQVREAIGYFETREEAIAALDEYSANRLSQKDTGLDKFNSKKKSKTKKDAETELKIIDEMNGFDFEKWCADLLKGNGYEKIIVTSKSNDQGVDILCECNEVKYCIQCKRFKSHIGNTPVQEIIGGKMYYGCHVAVVMTNSTFTKGATELAKKSNVLLWDREKLIQMIIDASAE